MPLYEGVPIVFKPPKAVTIRAQKFMSQHQYVDAEKVFVEAKEKGEELDVVAYNMFMECLRRTEKVESLEPLLAEMRSKGVRPNASTFNVILSAYGSQGDLDRMMGFFSKMKEDGIQPEVLTYTALVSCFRKANNVEEMIRLIRECKVLEPDVSKLSSLYNNMLEYYGSRDVEQMVKFLEKMRAEGVTLTEYTMGTVVSAFGRKGLLAEMLVEFKKMKEGGVRPNRTVYNSMIDACGRNGDLQTMTKVFEDMTKEGIKPDKFTSSSMLQAFARKGDVDTMLFMAEKMKTLGVVPDNTILTGIIATLHRFMRKDKIVEWVTDIPKSNVRKDFRLIFVSVHALSTVDVDKALTFFYHTKKTSRVPFASSLYALMLNQLRIRGRVVEMKKLFAELKAEGMVVTQSIFNIMIRGLGKNGELEEMEKVTLECINSEEKWDLRLSNFIVELFSRRGERKKVLQHCELIKPIIDNESYQRALQRIQRIPEGEPIIRLFKVPMDPNSKAQKPKSNDSDFIAQREDDLW